MDKLRKIMGMVDIFVFAATTLAIAGVFYEGMTLKWYDFVGDLRGLLIYAGGQNYTLVRGKRKDHMDTSFPFP